MKQLSIVISHFNRKEILYKTLQAYMLYESVNNCEFIIVDDGSNSDNNLHNIRSDFPQLDINFIEILKSDKRWLLPTFPFNLGVKLAKSDKCIITNPECLPMGDIVNDVINTLPPDTYQVYGCYSIDKYFTNKILRNNISSGFLKSIKSILPLTTETQLLSDGQNAWYQHSVYRPYMYCFCLAIFKNDFEKIGGINDLYSQGMGYGDDDLVLAAQQNNLKIIQKDEPFVLHLNHYTGENNYLLTKAAERNKALFEKRKAGTINTICSIFDKLYKKYLKQNNKLLQKKNTGIVKNVLSLILRIKFLIKYFK